MIWRYAQKGLHYCEDHGYWIISESVQRYHLFTPSGFHDTYDTLKKAKEAATQISTPIAPEDDIALEASLQVLSAFLREHPEAALIIGGDRTVAVTRRKYA